MGFGSQLAGGDLIYHCSSQISKGKWFSILLITIMLGSGLLSSWICSIINIPFITDWHINPLMPNLHLLSANVTIVISIVVFIIGTCFVYDDLKDKKKTAKHILGSFFTGVFLALGITICGLSARSRLFEGLTPG